MDRWPQLVLAESVVLVGLSLVWLVLLGAGDVVSAPAREAPRPTAGTRLLDAERV